MEYISWAIGVFLLQTQCIKSMNSGKVNISINYNCWIHFHDYLLDKHFRHNCTYMYICGSGHETTVCTVCLFIFYVVCVPEDLMGDESTLMEVMAWCCKSPSHYPTSMLTEICSVWWYQKTTRSQLQLVGPCTDETRISTGITKSIPWLLMPWLLASPGHLHPLYCQCKINRSLSFMGNDFNNLLHLSVEKWRKIQINFYISWNKFSVTRVSFSISPPLL